MSSRQVGLPGFFDKNNYFSQSNNSIETYNKTQKLEGLNHWTESCGPTAAVTILSAGGWHLEQRPLLWNPQAEDLLFLWFNDPRNESAWRAARPDVPPFSIPGNRIPQLYLSSVSQVFGFNSAKFIIGLSFDQVLQKIKQGAGVQICLKNPGHYLAVGGADLDSNELIYNDPWPQRHSDGNGFNRRMTRAEFEKNVQNFFIVYQF